jgi:large subunit ribosomal protein L35
MPKVKTRKSLAKRFVITKKKKVLKRSTGQDHYNARESGKQKRNKRGDRAMAGKDAQNIKKLLPYN